MVDIHPAVKKLEETFPALTLDVKLFREEVTITVPKNEIVEICKFLYADPDLQYQFFNAERFYQIIITTQQQALQFIFLQGFED